jgi:phosphoribosyl 1,2-cyclic phosphodiesterase
VSFSVTLLGSGTSQGVPLVGCLCPVCKSSNPKNVRLRTSLLIQIGKRNVLIDCSSDFRQQALTVGLDRLDSVLVTHSHWDHISGLDDTRPLTHQSALSLYVPEKEIAGIKQVFDYAFNLKTQKGGGLPSLMIHPIVPYEEFDLFGMTITPLLVEHGDLEIVGYRFGSIAYITDAKYIPEKTLDLISDVDLLFINCLRIKAHSTHMNLEETLNVLSRVSPKKTYLIHTTHDLEYDNMMALLPEGVEMGFDGLAVECDSE